MRTIVKNCIFTIVKKRKREDHIIPNQELVEHAFQEKWELEWHDHLFAEAMQLLRDEMEPISFQAFYLYAIQETAPSAVAAKLGISVNAVYINKNRALEQLRRIIRQLKKV